MSFACLPQTSTPVDPVKSAGTTPKSIGYPSSSAQPSFAIRSIGSEGRRPGLVLATPIFRLHLPPACPPPAQRMTIATCGSRCTTGRSVTRYPSHLAQWSVPDCASSSAIAQVVRMSDLDCASSIDPYSRSHTRAMLANLV
jgi:hypothetical protein